MLVKVSAASAHLAAGGGDIIAECPDEIVAQVREKSAKSKHEASA